MALELYPVILYDAEQVPECESEIEEACNAIHKATKGWGTDDKGLCVVLGSKDAKKRTKIAFHYKRMFENNLDELIKKEVGGKFGAALRLLSLPPDAMEARLVNLAMKGIGTRNGHLFPVVCGRSNRDIELLKKAYSDKFGRDLGE